MRENQFVIKIVTVRSDNTEFAERNIKMFYHASSIKGIVTLQPRISNHHIPLLYFSTKRENVLVYLSNAVEKFCRENGFSYSGVWQKWGPYGFDTDGIQRLEEYYPHALVDTYKGVSGYIYSADHVEDSGFQTQIPYAVTSEKPVTVLQCEYIPDAYEAILDAEKRGLIRITRYEALSREMHEWNKKTIREEYKNAFDHPEYRFFLKGKFGEILKSNI